MTAVLHVWPLLVAALGWLYGHVDRVVERARFKVTMTRHGYHSHGQYVNGHEWKTRRGAYIRARHRPPCWCCARRFRPEFPIHHLDYSRAGFGGNWTGICGWCARGVIPGFTGGIGRGVCCGRAGCRCGG